MHSSSQHIRRSLSTSGTQSTRPFLCISGPVSQPTPKSREKPCHVVRQQYLFGAHDPPRVASLSCRSPRHRNMPSAFNRFPMQRVGVALEQRCRLQEEECMLHASWSALPLTSRRFFRGEVDAVVQPPINVTGNSYRRFLDFDKKMM